jgi:hypothetical protein
VTNVSRYMKYTVNRDLPPFCFPSGHAALSGAWIGNRTATPSTSPQTPNGPRERIAAAGPGVSGSGARYYGYMSDLTSKFSATGCTTMKTFMLLILISLAAAFAAPRTSAQSCTTATCNAGGVSEAQFLAALPSPSNTNATVVVTIPGGTASWTTGFSYTVPSAVTNLTIQGSTTVSCTGTAGTSNYSCTAADNTVIQDAYASNSPLMSITVGGPSTTFRMTGLTVEGGDIGSSSYNKYNCLVNFSGGSQNFRVDHSHFDNTTYTPAATSSMVRIGGSIEGVMDHNVVDLGSNTSDANGFQTFNDIGDSIGNGDGAWASPTGWGTSEFVFMENNQFNGGYPNDCTVAGRFVMRYNFFNGSSTTVQTHATKSDAGPIRGCRGYEYYHNYIVNSSEGDAATGSKGGPALVWGNTMAPNAYYRFWAGSTDRQSGGQAETATPNGWGYCGTAVLSNGVGSGWDGNSILTLGYPCLDGLGRGQTVQALNGANFPNRLNSSTGTIAWPHQYLEPIYLFDNSFGSATLSIRDTSTTQNIDVFSDNPAFVGATGTGSGLLAARPLVCAPGLGGTYYTSPTGSYGVAYWATDANSGNGELYVCTSLNNWTGIYQPYTYPHPLVGGGTSGNPPNPPAGLTATVD